MTRHEQVDSVVDVLSMRPMPRDLRVAEPLRSVLNTVEYRSTTHPDTLHVARAIAECTIHPMVTDLANTVDDGLITRLIGINNWWRERTAEANTATHDALTHVSRYYLPSTSRRGPYELGNALYAASRVIEYAYPVNHANSNNPDRQPRQGDLLQIVSLFAVTSQVHLDMCGPDRNQAAIEGLVLRIASFE